MSDLDQHLVEALVTRVVETLAERDPGHCLQIPHVPEALADKTCELVDKQIVAPDIARVVCGSPGAAWQATPAKIVELRNSVEDQGGRLALFVPAGERMAAEDSFGRSTFELLKIGDLYDSVARDLGHRLHSVAPGVAERAESIVAAVRHDSRYSVSGKEAAAYLARIEERPSEAEVGAALVEFGLLPDSGLGTEDDAGVQARLARNLGQMETLTDLAPPADRIDRLALSMSESGHEAFVQEIASVLDDGTVDRRTIAQRFDRDDRPVDFKDVLDSDTAASLTRLAIVDLTGDFVSGSDPPTVKKQNAAIKTKYRCTPAANTVAGMKSLRLELLRIGSNPMERAEAGVEASKTGNSLPKKEEGTWTIRIPTDAVDPGLHCLRLQAVNEDNLVLKEVESEPFAIEEQLEEADSRTVDVSSLPAALAGLRIESHDRRLSGTPQISLAEEGKNPVDEYLIRFEGTATRFRLQIARPLATVEGYSFADPRSLARYRLSLATGEIEETLIPEAGLELPEEFLVARESLFEDLVRAQHHVEPSSRNPIVAIADLSGLDGSISRYVREWTSALRSPDPRVVRAMLMVDQIELSDSDLTDGVLVGPTHPLRIAWLSRYQRLLGRWSEGGPPEPPEATQIEGLLKTLAPGNLPQVLPGKEGELRYLEPISLFWGLWAPPGARDVSALASEVRSRLHLSTGTVGAIDVDDVVDRVHRYLVAHPYVDLLEMNFVQPGDADLVLRTLLALQKDIRTRHLRYVVRLFAAALSPAELGSSLDEFMADPEATKAGREVADPFLASADDPLIPKLTYSKHAVSDLLEDPERFPAHLSFFLDWFALDAVPVPPVQDRRSFFAEGLIIDPVAVYRPAEGELNPQWDEHVAVPADSEDEFVAAVGAYERAAATVLDSESWGSVPAVRLELDGVNRSILDAVHRTSDWVVVIDPVFADDYLDSPPQPGESPRYLIDAASPRAPGMGRRVVVSTRSREELGLLLGPTAAKYGLEVSDERIEVLVQALRVLSPGLPLKLLNNRTQALEAFSLSLASLFLSARGVLRRALAIPLDMHQDLFRAGGGAGEPVDLRRTDLAVISLDPESRRLSVNLVEVKARGSLPSQIPQGLIEEIDAQLENSRSALRSNLFGVELRDQDDTLAGALVARRLIRLLDGYLERAARYELLGEAAELGSYREFIGTLDESYVLNFDKHALIFDFEGSSQPPERIDGVLATRIGREEITDVLDRTQTPVGTHVVAPGTTELVGALLESDVDPTSERVSPVEAPPDTDLDTPADEEDEPAREPEVEPIRDSGFDESEGPDPDKVALIGGTSESRQYGVVGRIHGTDQDVAFDVDGTNVVSVFGVQGSGKSYSVGNLIEAGGLRSPALNRVPHPLATVVFHYSADQTYAPEFVTMAEPNQDVQAAEKLLVDYDAEPRGLDDVRILVPPALAEERSEEYGDDQMGDLVLAPDELDVNDWRLLMGVRGGDQMYVKAMGTIFRKLRKDLTLASLKKAIKESTALTPTQKSLAQTRVEFVESFVADGAGVSSAIRPGRLVVADVRDPWLEEDNALALFMVLLRVCAQAKGDDGRSFNKLIVFDEAHKYMGNPNLTDAIVEAVREMRHKGTTVVIASQDPPSLPGEILELSSVVIAHRFTSPKWLQHLSRVNEAFASGLTPAQLAGLKSGEAFVWSAGGAREFRSPQRVEMRPRLTQHGGQTKRASGDS